VYVLYNVAYRLFTLAGWIERIVRRAA